jgi:hypothetical protein
VIHRVAAAAAVAHADVEIAVMAECHVPAVVIGERLRDVATSIRPAEIEA